MTVFSLETGYDKCLLVSQNIPLKIIIGEKRKLLWYVSIKIEKISTCTVVSKRKTCNFTVA